MVLDEMSWIPSQHTSSKKNAYFRTPKLLLILCMDKLSKLNREYAVKLILFLFVFYRETGSINPRYGDLLRQIQNKIDSGGYSTAAHTEKRNILRIGKSKGLEVIKPFLSSAQLSMKFQLFIDLEIVKINGKFIKLKN